MKFVLWNYFIHDAVKFKKFMKKFKIPPKDFNFIFINENLFQISYPLAKWHDVCVCKFLILIVTRWLKPPECWTRWKLKSISIANDLQLHQKEANQNNLHQQESNLSTSNLFQSVYSLKRTTRTLNKNTEFLKYKKDWTLFRGARAF